MFEAFIWGAAAAAMLLVGAVVAHVARPGPKPNAVIMAVGAGLLFGSVAYDLIEEALQAGSFLLVSAAFFLGSIAFVLGDWLLDRRGGKNRKDPNGEQAAGSAEAIVMGSVLDGIPESFVLGLTVLQGGVSIPLLVGVALSNLPEGMSSSSGLRSAGWSLGRVSRMWAVVVLVSALAAVAGYVLLNPKDGIGLVGQAVAQAFAAGALLTMLSDTMVPEAYQEVRHLTGGLVALGFAGSLALAAL